MKKLFILFVISVFVFSGCNRENHVVLHTQQETGRSDSLYVEESILSGNYFADTILYYKMNFKNEKIILKKSPDLDIGIKYMLNKYDSACKVEYCFKGISHKVLFPEIRVSNNGNQKTSSNFTEVGMPKSICSAFDFDSDQYLSPAVSNTFCGTDKMENFISWFHDELQQAMKNSDLLVYTSNCHIEGYFQKTQMIVRMK